MTIMQGTKKQPYISFLKPTPDPDISCQSWRSPIETHFQESVLSKKSSLETGLTTQCEQNEKFLDFSLQGPDSCSTESTDQSYSRATTNGEINLNSQTMVFAQSGCHVSHGKQEVSDNKYTSSMGSQIYGLPHLQADCNPTLTQLDFPVSDQYFSSVLPTYGPQAVMMGIAPARVPLPLDFSSNEPVYVNPKQYHGILRRRQHRAKLEAQRKFVQNRKPYLHESRHQHALKRARGSGGRFLNKKKVQESSKPGGNIQHNLTGNRVEYEASPHCSDVTSASTSDDIYHHPLEFSFSSYPSCVGGTMQLSGGTYV